MTSLAVSVSIDARGPSGLYIITDSRISWNTGQHWDAGQKTFASFKTPDIFGFCGDAFFPPAILRQLLEFVNSELIFQENLGAEARHFLIKDLLICALKKQVNVLISPFSIFHGARDGEGMNSKFRVWETKISARAADCGDTELDINEDKSYLVHIDGSGGKYVKKKNDEWLKTDAEGTSRASIWSFCDALQAGQDPSSGGPPQLVGIWRKGPARHFGMIWQGKRYLSGLDVPEGSDFNKVQWFNSLFERCDGETKKKLEDAQRHAKP